VPTPGNGPDNSVRISVTAKNSIGESDPASASGAVWSDVVPAAPTDLGSSPLDHGLAISWTKPPDTGGSAITKYVISVEGISSDDFAVPASDPVGTQYTQNITDAAIDNGSSVGYSVSARNGALTSLATWNKASGTGHPAGPPQRSSSPNASANTDDGGSASLDWSGAFSSNGRAISDYYAAIFSSGDSPPTCGVTGDVPGSPDVPGDSSTFQHMGTATATTFTGLTPNTTYSFVVYAFNGMGCTASVTVTATPRERPGTVTAISKSGPTSSGTNTWDYKLNNFTIGSGSTDADSFEYELSGGDVDGETFGQDAKGSFLDTSNNSQYGQDISVKVKACRMYPETTLCSADWSKSFHLGVPVNNTVPSGLSFSHDAFADPGDPATQGSWSWTAAPDGQYSSIRYSCGGSNHTIAPGDPGTCAVTETSSGSQDFPKLTITIVANNARYSRTYDWHDYDTDTN
jgi:hypothetical protein